MKIARRKDDGVVTHAGDLRFGGSGLTGFMSNGARINVPHVTEATHDLVEVEALPTWFKSGSHVHDDTGGFARTAEGQTVRLAERKAAMQEQAQSEFDQVMLRGFADDDGVRWSTTGDARNKVLKLTQRIQEHRDGEVSSALPRAKATVRLIDATNTSRDADPAKIKALAEKGDDFIDETEDRLVQLLGEIGAAALHDDLDAVDVTAGWPP